MAASRLDSPTEVVVLTGVVPVRGSAAGKDPEELSSGRAWRAALVWAGASISGTTSMWWAAAAATMVRKSSWV